MSSKWGLYNYWKQTKEVGLTDEQENKYMVTTQDCSRSTGIMPYTRLTNILLRK